MLPTFLPTSPGAIKVMTFQELRAFVVNYVINRWQQYVITYFNTNLLPSLNTQQFGYGPDIASATTISPTNLIHQVTGSTEIDTINAPQGFAGMFVAIATNGFTTGTSGNILLATTVAAGHSALFVFHPVAAKWGVITS